MRPARTGQEQVGNGTSGLQLQPSHFDGSQKRLLGSGSLPQQMVRYSPHTTQRLLVGSQAVKPVQGGWVVQQTAPSVPHDSQVLFAMLQARLVPLQRLPAQHGSLRLPHFWQLPAAVHCSPVAQSPSAQH
jgi:hypothetical protein